MNILLQLLPKKTHYYIYQHQQFFLFLVVGGINTVFGYSVFALFIYFGFHYYTAVFLATIIGILFNFKTTGSLVFKNRDRKLIIKFFMNAGIVYLVSVGFMKFFNSFITNEYMTGAIVSAMMPFLGFYLNKRLFTLKAANTPINATHTN